MMSEIPIINGGTTIQKVAESLLLETVAMTEENRAVGYSYKEILAMVKEKFPEGLTTIKCLYYYQANLRARGHIMPIRPSYNIVKHLKESQDEKDS